MHARLVVVPVHDEFALFPFLEGRFVFCHASVGLEQGEVIEHEAVIIINFNGTFPTTERQARTSNRKSLSALRLASLYSRGVKREAPPLGKLISSDCVDFCFGAIVSSRGRFGRGMVTWPRLESWSGTVPVPEKKK